MLLNSGFEPAIRSAGYTAFRLDKKEHINKVDDEIIAENVVRVSLFRTLLANPKSRAAVFILKLGLQWALAFLLYGPADQRRWMIFISILGNSITLCGNDPARSKRSS